jgi:hypothetical protein
MKEPARILSIGATSQLIARSRFPPNPPVRLPSRSLFVKRSGSIVLHGMLGIVLHGFCTKFRVRSLHRPRRSQCRPHPPARIVLPLGCAPAVTVVVCDGRRYPTCRSRSPSPRRWCWRSWSRFWRGSTADDSPIPATCRVRGGFHVSGYHRLIRRPGVDAPRGSARASGQVTKSASYVPRVQLGAVRRHPVASEGEHEDSPATGRVGVPAP